MPTDLHAAIDIGTNTVLLLVSAKKDEIMEPIREEQSIPRLGKGVDASGNLSELSMDRVIEVLMAYKKILQSEFPNIKSLTVTATSAVRDAVNRSFFMDRVREETGFEIKLLSGREEAEYTFAGALSMLSEAGQAAVIDIGGGSTEIACGKNGVLGDSHSFNMGSVRFTERFIRSDPPEKDEVIRCRNEIKKILQSRPFDFVHQIEEVALVGVAGTVTSLAYMDIGLTKYDTEQVNGYCMTAEKINKWVKEISESNVNSLEETYPEVMKGRAEIILAGLLILDEFINFYDFPELVVSTGGIRHGAILLGD